MLQQTVQRYVALGVLKTAILPPAIPEPRLRVDTQNQQRLIQKYNLKINKPVIGMMPGAEYGPAKQWPIESYRELAEKLTVQGYRVWVYGSLKEQNLGEKISVNSDIVNLCGKTQLEDVVDLLAACESVVSNDSGLMHIAAAVGIKLVVIYGSSTPGYTPPLTNKANIIYHQLECSPCFERECQLGHYDCLRKITTEEVMENLC